jgi:hypothetical protein
MEIIIPFLACIALGAPIGFAGALLIGSGPEFMRGLFSGPTELGWPHGVQEEDPPGGWTWRLPGEDRPSAPLPVSDRIEPLPVSLAGVPVQPGSPRRIEIVDNPPAVDHPLVLEPIAARVRSRVGRSARSEEPGAVISHSR